MRTSTWTPGAVPYGADQTLYLIIDRQAGSGGFREIEIERASFETVISDLMSGRVNDPRRVIAFNTLEHWSEDISQQVAQEIQSRCDIAGERIPEHIGDFVGDFTMPMAPRAGQQRPAPRSR